mmetsp:Transcript_11432/g.42939  ORF Transcript_11432/g.42939 Transcript_11432/m.42939 type:complete len:390 (-) Transcript_11432:157-1326(-)|eukprot:CAMPEP_0117444586 /NCGR_PEP_ID=MMETSP0759-20121206/5319_1 /TAXON_ID=63605 /ORGANISM="Percolomonas cosmopolitus, Strain WS" /LENGTH=389 /DNA_ID=CAMNT_0005236661 /DNA_START=146 /DNA_END=1315 /DNA_ORIENTATION=-
MTATTKKSPSVLSNESLQCHIATYNQYLEPLGLFIEPFLLKQYNSNVQPEFRIGTGTSGTLQAARASQKVVHGDTVCLMVGSNAKFCGEIMEKFAKNLPYELHTEFQSSPVHCITKYYLKQFKISQLYKCFGFNIETLHDFDMIQNRPRLLVQSAGHVSGMAFYYRPQQYGFDPELKYGCSMHSTYAGWFGFRGAFILKDYICEDFEAKEPIDVFAGNKDEIQYMLELFNQFDARWRDTVPTLLRYDPRQIEFFETEPSKRKLPGMTGAQKHHEPVGGKQTRDVEQDEDDTKHQREPSEGMSFMEKDQLMHDASYLHDDESDEEQQPSAPQENDTKVTISAPSPKKKPNLTVRKPDRGSTDVELNRTPADIGSFVDDALDLYEVEEKKA